MLLPRGAHFMPADVEREKTSLYHLLVTEEGTHCEVDEVCFRYM